MHDDNHLLIIIIINCFIKYCLKRLVIDKDTNNNKNYV